MNNLFNPGGGCSFALNGDTVFYLTMASVNLYFKKVRENQNGIYRYGFAISILISHFL